MKIKLDFITNSSSEAFCVYGVDIELTDLVENSKLIKYLYLVLIAYWREVSDYCNDRLLEFDFPVTKERFVEEYESYLFQTIRYYAVINHFLWEMYGEEPAAVYIAIGRSPWSMCKTQTLGEFQCDVRDDLKDIGFGDYHPRAVEEVVRY